MFQFEPGVSVKGTVRVETLDSRARPPGEVDIALVPRQKIVLSETRLAWNADHRSFVFTNVRRGPYTLSVTSPAPYYVKSVRLDNEEVGGNEFNVTGAMGSIEIVLSDNGGSLEATVAGSDGSSLSSMVLLVSPGRPPIYGDSTNEGKLTIRNLPPGDYRVYAFDDGRNVEYADPEWMQRNGGSGAPLTIAPGQMAHLSLTSRTTPQP